uniref:Mediator of RNA polymerase II transcription subunit 29 n=1 Tax=Canis lupus dingo TaxID=286419 RepID=A0A8C0KTC4_CANLU
MAASQQQAAAASSAAGVSGPGSSGGPGPQQQPQPPAQLVGPAQSGLLQQQQQDFDPVQRYKMLIPQLKESLQTLMKVAAQNLIQNTNIDNGHFGWSKNGRGWVIKSTDSGIRGIINLYL